MNTAEIAKDFYQREQNRSGDRKGGGARDYKSSLQMRESQPSPDHRKIWIVLTRWRKGCDRWSKFPLGTLLKKQKIPMG